MSWREWSFKKVRAGGLSGGARGRVPVQLLADFRKNQKSRSLGEIEPCIKGAWEFGDVRGIFPEELSAALIEGILGCEQILPGFSRGGRSAFRRGKPPPPRQCAFCAERLWRAPSRGLYPCGEGAGYAGGITSAAMDGIKTAEAVAACLRKMSEYGDS